MGVLRYRAQVVFQRLDLMKVRRLRMCWPPVRVQRMPLRQRRILTSVVPAASTGPLPIGRPRVRNVAYVMRSPLFTKN